MFTHVKYLSFCTVHRKLHVFFVEQDFVNNVYFVVVCLNVLKNVRIMLLHNKLKIFVHLSAGKGRGIPVVGYSSDSNCVYNTQHVSCRDSCFVHIYLHLQLTLHVQKLHVVKAKWQKVFQQNDVALLLITLRSAVVKYLVMVVI